MSEPEVIEGVFEEVVEPERMLPAPVRSLVPAQPGQALVATSDDPSAMVVVATRLADALKDIVERQRLYATISGKKYPEVEAWMTIGRLDNVVAREASLPQKMDDGGWVAEVVLVRLSDGMEVGRASSICGSKGDSPWDSRSDLNKRSMAVTRATSRAFRQQYSWVMALAGYQATPADEMPRDDASGASESHADARPASGSTQGHKKGDEWPTGPVGYQMKVSEAPKGVERTTDGLAVMSIVAKRGNSKHTVMVEGPMAEWAARWVEAVGQEVAVTGTLYEHLWEEGKPTQKRIRDVTKLGIHAAAGWQVFPEGGASADPPQSGTEHSPSGSASSSAPSPKTSSGSGTSSTPDDAENLPLPTPEDPTGTPPRTGSAPVTGATSAPKDEPTSSPSGDDATASPSESGTTMTSAGEIFDLARATGVAGERVDVSGTILSQSFTVTGSGTPLFGMRLAGDDGYEYHWAVATGSYPLVLQDDKQTPKWPLGTPVRLIGTWSGNGRIAVLAGAMLR